jgi:hypothetical protein
LADSVGTAIGSAAGAAASGGIAGTAAQILATIVKFLATEPNASSRLDQLFVDHGLTPDKVAEALKHEHLTTDAPSSP